MWVATELDTVSLPDSLYGRRADVVPLGQIPHVPVQALIPFQRIHGGDFGHMQAIINNRLLNFFGNRLLRWNPFHIPQTPNSQFPKPLAPMEDVWPRYLQVPGNI